LKKRLTALIVCLCLCLSACSLALPEAQAAQTEKTAEAQPTPSPEPTAEPTPEPTPEPVCEHSYEKGVCTLCGDVCAHESFIAGYCSLCGEEHDHLTHVQSESPFEAPVCPDCGGHVLHNWVNGVCTVCAQEFEFIEEALPKEIVCGEYASQHGTVETFEYDSHYYNLEGEVTSECVKHLTVYLPYGYDESQPYDLIIMCVGKSGASTIYFDDNYDYFKIARITGAAEMLDVLIERRLCKPFIGVTIEYRASDYDYGMHYQPDGAQVANELKKDILPLLCEKYSLYPQDASPEELLANREHLAFWGVSYGGYICHRAAVESCFEIFGWYSSVSGGWETGGRMADAIKDSDLPIYYFYSVDGQQGLDECANCSKNDYRIFEQQCPLVTEGVNGHAGTIVKGAHDATTWITAMFNFARLVFYTE